MKMIDFLELKIKIVCSLNWRAIHGIVMKIKKNIFEIYFNERKAYYR